jgi:hypothetical protein
MPDTRVRLAGPSTSFMPGNHVFMVAQRVAKSPGQGEVALWTPLGKGRRAGRSLLH